MLDESLGILDWAAELFFSGKSEEIGDTEERLASEGESSRVRPANNEDEVISSGILMTISIYRLTILVDKTCR